jgi:hypothetical protein
MDLPISCGVITHHLQATPKALPAYRPLQGTAEANEHNKSFVTVVSDRRMGLLGG